MAVKTQFPSHVERRFCPACGGRLTHPMEATCRDCRRVGSVRRKLLLLGVVLAGLSTGSICAVAISGPAKPLVTTIQAGPPGSNQQALLVRLLPAPAETEHVPPAHKGAVFKQAAYQRVDPMDQRLQGLQQPLDRLDGLPKGRDLYPGVARSYRNGWHEGLDFYPEDGWNKGIGWGTPVSAVKDGVIDTATTVSFVEMTAAEHKALLAQAHALGFTPMDLLIKLRGRSVWVNHGSGFKSCYAHLSALAEGIRPGMRVSKGQIVGYVGNTGTTAGVNHTRGDCHLHLELWLDGRIAGFQWTQQDYERIWHFDKGKAVVPSTTPDAPIGRLFRADPVLPPKQPHTKPSLPPGVGEIVPI